MSSVQINLWIFPMRDFDDWRKLVEPEECADTYAEYMNILKSTEEYMAIGVRIIYARFTVEKMIEELQTRGLENTSENRAIVIAHQV